MTSMTANQGTNIVRVAHQEHEFETGGPKERRDRTTVLRWEYPKRRYRARVIVSRDEEGALVTSCPALPGAVSQGSDAEEAISNLREAIAGCIQSYLEAGEPIPWVQDPPDVEPGAILTRWIDVDV